MLCNDNAQILSFTSQQPNVCFSHKIRLATVSPTLAETSQGFAVNSPAPMQSLYLIRAEKQGKHVVYLIHSSHAP